MRHPVKLALWLFSFFLLSTVARAQGGPPMVTDDPGTPGNKHWEINVAYTTQRSTGFTYVELPELDLNYGYGDRIQLKLQFPYAFTNTPGLGRAQGLGDTNWGVKWRFFDQGDGKLQISTYPQYTTNGFRSSLLHGLVNGDADLFLPLEFADQYGPLELDAEFGYDIHREAPNEGVLGFIVGHDFKPGPELLLEYHLTRDALNAQQTFVNLGIRQPLRKGITLIAAYGKVVANSGPQKLNWLGYFGFQFTF